MQSLTEFKKGDWISFNKNIKFDYGEHTIPKGAPCKIVGINKNHIWICYKEHHKVWLRYIPKRMKKLGDIASAIYET